MYYGENMKIEKIIHQASEMIALGEAIGKQLKENMVLTLEGDLGAGKTTMTKGIALGLDIPGVINSPTFTIMKTYKGRLDLYHMDVYRVDSQDFELEEYFDNGGVCVIEWAQNIKELLPDEYLEIEIFDLGQNQRRVTLRSHGVEFDAILEAIR